METVVTVIGAEEIADLLKNLPEDLFKGARKEFKDAAFRVHKTVSLRVRDGSGDTLHSRTGQLRRSLKPRVYGNTLKTLGSEVYSDKRIAPYAPTHEREPSTTIRAVQAYARVPGGPYLNIPLPANLTKAGVMRQNAGMVFRQGGRLSQSRAGNWIVWSANNQPMFVLKKEVTIPARLKLRETGIDEVPTLLSKLSAGIDKAFKEADE